MAVIWYVHGAGATPLSFNWLHKQLPCDAKFFTYDIIEPADSAIERLHRLIDLETESVILLGHSLGGIIATTVANHPRVQKLITLCAPFGGLPHAGITSFFNAAPIFRDLRPYSSLLLNIRVYPLIIPHLAIIAERSMPHFTEPNDGVITVASQMAISHQSYHKFSLNHFEVLLSPDVSAAINDFLLS